MSVQKSPYWQNEKERIRVWARQYHQRNKERHREYYRKWRAKHLEEVRVKARKNQQNNSEHLKEYLKNYYATHKEQAIRYHKQYIVKHPEAIKKIIAKRRGLDFIPLNRFFEGSEAHHVDKARIVWIPVELHKSVRHNLWTGYNMDKINGLVFKWLGETTKTLTLYAYLTPKNCSSAEQSILATPTATHSYMMNRTQSHTTPINHVLATNPVAKLVKHAMLLRQPVNMETPETSLITNHALTPHKTPSYKHVEPVPDS